MPKHKPLEMHKIEMHWLRCLSHKTGQCITEWTVFLAAKLTSNTSVINSIKVLLHLPQHSLSNDPTRELHNDLIWPEWNLPLTLLTAVFTCYFLPKWLLRKISMRLFQNWPQLKAQILLFQHSPVPRMNVQQQCAISRSNFSVKLFLCLWLKGFNGPLSGKKKISNPFSLELSFDPITEFKAWCPNFVFRVTSNMLNIEKKM